MKIYYDLLTVLYLVIAVVISGFVVWNMFKSKKLTDKIIGGITLVMFVLRIFLIK